ncbi:MAG: hypothetical protein VB878_01365 [Pirellulaceae bacterium]
MKCSHKGPKTRLRLGPLEPHAFISKILRLSNPQGILVNTDPLTSKLQSRRDLLRFGSGTALVAAVHAAARSLKEKSRLVKLAEVMDVN